MDRHIPGQTASEFDAVVATLAASQFGVMARRQVLALGGTPAKIEHRFRARRWEPILPGVYRIAGVPASRRQSAMAAALWAGSGALVSHAAAATLFGFEGVRARKIELWVPSTRSRRSGQVIVHRGTRLDRADRTMLGPIPVTTATRTLIDIAGRLEDHRLLAVMEDLFHRHLMEPDRLRARVAALRTSGRPGVGRLEALLASRGDGPPMESALETLVSTLILEAGVARPVRQHWVVLGGSRYRLDFAWPEHRFALECDGYEHHGDRARWGKGRLRLAEFGAVGWRVVPVTWTTAKHEPSRVIGWLRRALPSAAGRSE